MRTFVLFMRKTFALCNESSSSAYIQVEVKMKRREERVPWFLWPFWAVWRLVAFVIEMTGRLVGLILGMVFILVGVLVSLTIVGAVIGVPLILFGILLMLRSLF
jgi:hypothetical protein